MSEAEVFLNGRVSLHCGDCRESLKEIPDNSIDSIVTDPPYALVSIVKRFGGDNAAPVKVPEGASGAYARASRGFMGKQWDTGEAAFSADLWVELLRALKPGGHVIAFGGTRTYHRLACAIEDAGFEIRDQIQYLYGSGFPKNHNVTKGLGDAICSCEALPERDVRSVRDTNVSPPIDACDERGEVLLASLPEQGSPGAVLRPKSTKGGQGRTKRSMEGRRDVSEAPRELCMREIHSLPAGTDIDGADGRLCNGASRGDGELVRSPAGSDRVCSPYRPSAAEQSEVKPGTVAGQSKPQARGTWENCGRCGKPIVSDGWGTALKPACEPCVLARKPLSEKTVAANVLKWGTGALNIDGCRIESSGDHKRDFVAARPEREIYGSRPRLNEGFQPTNAEGRWPANLVHDGSEEVIAAFPANIGPSSRPGNRSTSDKTDGWGMGQRAQGHDRSGLGYADAGSAARFFYTAKADSDDRLGSKHPTVKPLDLMQWLVRLVTPKGGTVLDPFAGTGTTGEAAFREGMKSILIEREEEYQNDIRRRVKLMLSGPDERRLETIKEKTKDKQTDDGPLFAGVA